ncbi:SF1B family DNA helicase RecD2 [Magnetococcus sp. PR-3]|uniref:SF1B family DNA helicase RecD2 n=1 Tax=Magnetococcus sp. PR-3 TaxID=3120355 RepID=UPI002FCE5B65
MESFTGRIHQIIYHNPETGYGVLAVAPDEAPELNHTVVGTLPAPAVEMRVRVHGLWVSNAKYGLQFKAEKFEPQATTMEEAITLYLKGGGIKGIGKTLAPKLVQRFGSGLFDMLDERPDALLKIKGIGRANKEQIIQHWQGARADAQIMLMLYQLGFGPALTRAVSRKLKESHPEQDALKILKENPYLLAQVRGISFQRADRAALALDISPFDARRIEAAMLEVLSHLAGSEGHTLLEETTFHQRLAVLLQLQDEQEQLESMVLDRLDLGEGPVVRVVDADGTTHVQLARYHGYEKEIAFHLNRLQGPNPIGSMSEDWIQRVSRGAFTLSPDQQAALTTVTGEKMAILTGGPGMGKTTITRYVIEHAVAHKQSVKLCAPTGRAAKQLAEATGEVALTIHRLMGKNSDEEVEGKQTFSCDLLVVDESSMMDEWMASSLLKLLPDHCRVLLVGDADQLPSVAAGRVLQDLIHSGVVPVARLTEVHRQAEGSGIALGAVEILAGRRPQMARDLKFVEVREGMDHLHHCAQRMLDGVQKMITVGEIAAADIQVITPMHGTEVGVKALNEKLHEALNPYEEGELVFELEGFAYRAGCRVMQTKNDYELELYNGDQGEIVDLKKDQHGVWQIIARFDGAQKLLDEEQMRNIVPSYAITVHKSQGGQFGYVVTPVVTAHQKMLYRNLFYTCVTRARKGVVLVGSQPALQMAITFKENMQRHTGLCSRIQERMG